MASGAAFLLKQLGAAFRVACQFRAHRSRTDRSHIGDDLPNLSGAEELIRHGGPWNAFRNVPEKIAVRTSVIENASCQIRAAAAHPVQPVTACAMSAKDLFPSRSIGWRRLIGGLSCRRRGEQDNEAQIHLP